MFLNIKNNKSILLLYSIIILLLSLPVLAHNPSNSSTMLVEGKNNEWTLLISSSSIAFQHEIQNKYSVDSYKTPKEFSTLVVKHLLENISIICDDKTDVKLKKKVVKLGHSTKVSFKVIGMPKEFNSITVKNTSFENLNRNQSALIILMKDVAKEQFILNRENKHQLTLKIKENKFEVASKSRETQYTLWIYLSIILILLFIFLVFKIKLKPFKK